MDGDSRPWQVFDDSDKYEEACVVDRWRNGRPVRVVGTGNFCCRYVTALGVVDQAG